MTQATADPDYDFSLHGDGGPFCSVWLLMPLNEKADQWISEHISEDHATFGASIAIESRYLGDVVDGILDDGLSVEYNGGMIIRQDPNPEYVLGEVYTPLGCQEKGKECNA